VHSGKAPALRAGIAAIACGIGFATGDPSPGAEVDVSVDGAAILASRRLAMPVQGVPAAALRDTFFDGRPGHLHEAIDIAALKGTPVYAVDDGKLAKLFTSVPGGLTLYQFDPQGRLAYYYAHLDRYAAGLREGMTLRRCDLLGYVGTSGNAAANVPHLHFAVFRLGPKRQWWKGTPVNPYVALKDAASEVGIDPTSELVERGNASGPSAKKGCG